MNEDMNKSPCTPKDSRICLSFLQLDAHIVREQNFYQEGDITPYMQPITDLTLDTVWEELKALANYDDKVREVEEFNLANKYRKRGLAMVPARFG